jgi:hypothetical protein
MTKPILLATLLVSSSVASVASARPPSRPDNIAAPRPTELRTQSVQRNAKSDRTPTRSSPRTAAIETATPAARGLDIDDVLAKVNGVYMAGLQRCYRKTLAIDPSVSGKLDLAFKVAPDGTVTSALQGDGIERCLTNLIASWRFGVALDDGGMPTEASFKISLMLR